MLQKQFLINQIDYGFRYPFSGIEETLGSHRISLICRFGRPPADELEPGSVEAELVKLEKEQRELKARLEDAVEMKQKMEQVLIEEALARVKEKIKSVKYFPAKTKDGQITMAPKGYQTHIVIRGDTLRTIAEKYYGTNKKWLDIYNFNKDKIGRGGSLKLGTVILIPTDTQDVKDIQKLEEAKPQAQEQNKSSSLKPVTSTVDGGQKQSRPEKYSPKKTPAPVSTPVHAAEPARPKTHTVKPGETIKDIAEKYYGSAARWKDIYNANKSKVKMGRVIEDTVLTIP